MQQRILGATLCANCSHGESSLPHACVLFATDRVPRARRHRARLIVRASVACGDVRCHPRGNPVLWSLEERSDGKRVPRVSFGRQSAVAHAADEQRERAQGPSATLSAMETCRNVHGRTEYITVVKS